MEWKEEKKRQKNGGQEVEKIEQEKEPLAGRKEYPGDSDKAQQRERTRMTK